jgi:hypothetical protein
MDASGNPIDENGMPVAADALGNPVPISGDGVALDADGQKVPGTALKNGTIVDKETGKPAVFSEDGQLIDGATVAPNGTTVLANGQPAAVTFTGQPLQTTPQGESHFCAPTTASQSSIYVCLIVTRLLICPPCRVQMYKVQMCDLPVWKV